MENLIRKLSIGILGVLVLTATWGWYVTHPALWPEYRQANALIGAIEQFKSAQGRLPANLSELPTPYSSESSPVFYQVTHDGYEVWFGRSLGESYTYDSLSRSWR